MEFPQEPICQSCGIPLQKEEDLGTNADGSKNKEYCRFCFKGGKFTDEGITLEQKIEKLVEIGAKQMKMSEEMARHMAENILPKLKRWQRENKNN